MSKTDLTTSSPNKKTAADFIYQSISKSAARNSATHTTTTSPAADSDSSKSSPRMIPPAQQTPAELIPVRPSLKRERTNTSGSNRSGLLSMDLGFIRSDEINPDGGLVGLMGDSGRSIQTSEFVRDLIGSNNTAEASDDGSYTAPLRGAPEHARGDEGRRACPVVNLTQQLEKITTGDSAVPLDGDMRITSSDWIRDFGAEQSGGIGAMHPSMFGGPPVATSPDPARRRPAPVPSAGGYDEYEAPLRRSPPESGPGPFEPESLSRAPPLPQAESGASGTSPPSSGARRRRRKKKRVIDETRSIEYTDGDVLFGRGGFANKHPGNVKFRRKALELRPWYESVSKEEKHDISDLLVESVKAEGHRFLEKGGDGLWHEVIGNGARKKASQALRERIKGKRSSAKGRQNDLGGSTRSEGPAVDSVQELIGDIEPVPVAVENMDSVQELIGDIEPVPVA